MMILRAAWFEALTGVDLQGKVLITGQDATVPGLQRILEGTQAMTVYKPIVKEAQATGQLVAAISKGSSTSSLINGQTKTQGGVNIPWVPKYQRQWISPTLLQPSCSMGSSRQRSSALVSRWHRYQWHLFLTAGCSCSREQKR